MRIMVLERCDGERCQRAAVHDGFRRSDREAIHAGETSAISTTKRISAIPASRPTRAASIPNMYRGRLWTMRQFSGFGTAADTNERFHYLLKHGQTGLSVAFHLPTLMGYDSDHPMSVGEVGKCGVAIDSLADMETLFKGIPLDQISTSMTTNAPATILWSMYLAVAEKQGVDWKKLRGTIQNDILKEYIAQKTYIFPPKPSMKLIVDTFEFGTQTRSAMEHDLDQRISHSRSRIDGASGTGIHSLRRHRVHRMGAARRVSTSTILPRGCRSFSMRTTICLKKSRNIAPRARSGTKS